MRIPLCRLFTWDAVRPKGFPADIERIKDAFKRDGYIVNMAPLYATITDQEERIQPFTDADREVLDPFWRKLSDEWDELLMTGPPEWKFMVGKRLLCWDGNHRNMAWRQAAREAYENDKFYRGDLHPIVKCFVIKTTKTNWPEIEIAMNNQNT